MTKLLLFLFTKPKAEKEFLVNKFIRFYQPLLAILLLLVNQQSFGQIEVDTWYSADRAINTPSPDGQLQLYTPFAPADGTPVTTWYDLVDFPGPTNKQDAVQHPSDPAHYPNPWNAAINPGFQHSFGAPPFLNPIGTVPGIPTLRRNNMNFNPALEFDGSGDGEALHTRPISRGELTIFVVFRARGLGSSAETQRLLYGGDIDTHHSTTTNLSLGIATGDRFSVGRTWNGGDFFESGGINLMNRPTVGVFTRDVVEPLGTEEEILATRVNGLPDIFEIRNHGLAENDLYLFNRLGKHFNSNDSNRNLTGFIAEVLVADGPLDTNSIQRAESYLAIKYGITLNSAGSLGSIVGNQGYQYLAADGTLIWDPAINPAYRFDIAGLARDRYRDNNGASPDLRYNLHQRIAKSENDEAIVSMSTDSNFSVDNLNQTRPEIENATFGISLFSYRHNYLIWGNNRASLSSTNVELPPSGDITLRISREWKVQKTVSTGVTPISGVSIRVDLSGSDILTNDACGIQLMIDRDGDGDFTTGMIDYVTASSVAGSDAFFDNVDLEHLDVFTIGFGDFETPTASNPPTIDVCGTLPAPDPLVVTDEDDNCAVLSVVHVGDFSLGGTNPEIIARTYRITDTSGNSTDVTQTINVYPQPDAGSDGAIAICTTGGAATDLQAALNGTPDSGGNWADDDATGADLTDPANVDLSGLAPGTYDFTYSFAAVAPCAAAQATVTVTVTDQPDAGSDGAIAICTTGGAATDLQAALNGTPDSGGNWADDDATGADLTDPANVDLSGLAPGTYDFTYSFAAVAPCAAAQATVTVTVTDQPDAGSDGAIAICTTGGAATDLQAALNGTPDSGGNWADDDATGADLTDPANVDLSGLAPGTYDFTYSFAAVAPCAAAQATVTVTVTDQPDAGSDGAIAICTTGGAATDLQAALNGTPDSGGNWADDDATGADLTDPANVDLSGLAPGTYDFTYSFAAVAPCAAAQATVTVTVTDQPDAGSDGAIAICTTGGAATDLQAALNGTPDSGGNWADDDATGADLTDPANVDLSGLAPGTYDFTYSFAAVAPCAAAQATVTVTVTDQPDAGSDGAIAICTTGGAATDLQAALNGTPDSGGNWADDDATGADLTDPANVDLSGLAPGTYDFTYSFAAVAPCAAAQATVTVTVTDQPDAGSDGAIAICTTGGAATDLQAALNGTPDSGGNWADDDATGADLTDPANVDLSGLAPGTYDFTYSFAAVAPCAAAQATVTVTVTDQPDAGSDGAIAICTTGGAATDLQAALNGTPDSGGNWADDDATGADLTDPANVDLSGLAPGTYDFTYSFAAVAPCAAAQATVTVTVTDQPDAGSDGAIAICTTGGAATDLQAALNGTPDSGGNWADDDATGADLTDPANVDLSGLAPGTYDFTYSFAAVAPCAAAQATVTVTVTDQPDAGSDGAIAICTTGGAATDLQAALNGTPDSGGNWADDDATGADLTDPANVDLSGLAPGTYDFTYSFAAVAPCAAAQATVTVTVTDQPDAGSDGAIAICTTGGAATDLQAALNGTPDSGGNWADDDATGADLTDPANVDLSGLAPGTYDFTYSFAAVAPCAAAQATVTVTVTDQPDAGSDGAIAICTTGGAATDLQAALNGTPDSGGNWADDDATGADLTDPANVDLSGLAPGTYDFTYSFAAVAPCAAAQATVTVTVTDQPDAGSDGAIAICTTGGAATDLQAALNGTPDSGGNWADDDATGADLTDPANVDLSGLAPGTYDFTYSFAAVAPCAAAQATVTVTVTDQPDAGSDGAIAICTTGGAATDLQAALNGTPDSGGNWADDDATGADLTDPANVDLSGLAPGTYDFTYSFAAVAPCAAAQATVTVTVTDQPDAGSDGAIAICTTGGAATDLQAALNGTPDSGGNWADDDATGADLTDPANVDLSGLAPGTYDFTYSFAAVAPCAAAQATVTVTVTDQPLADALANVVNCGPYQLPPLSEGNYFNAPNGGGSALSPGDIINASTTLYVFSPANGSCPAVDNSFDITINSLSISLDISHESCWESGDGFVEITVENGVGPYNIQMSSGQVEIFQNETFTINELDPGNYSFSIIDSNGCQTMTEFDILPGGPNLDALIEPVYSCESGFLNNSIMVSLANPSISPNVLYALDSTELNDFVLTPEFENITVGNHFLSILHTNGCLTIIPFTIVETTPVELNLINSNMNEITANVSGGAPPYTYFFENQSGTSNNVFSIDRSGTFVVRVLDGNGCETIETITLNFTDIEIPNFFTPNNDGQNDFWRPRNIFPYPDIETFIFDRYGRKIKIMGALNEGWDGMYESKPLPSGDYWYVIQLNDGSGREFVGHFTLYR
ncbi:T9SS type B sorting domain-containing protein [Flagellimonas sp. S174]|uniref:T9SS type B sorting domain-containing protein n=1 Tax=Flagellimonas sp. S174 TaxID=3410790 RepID=UPI003BF4702D